MESGSVYTHILSHVQSFDMHRSSGYSPRCEECVIGCQVGIFFLIFIYLFILAAKGLSCGMLDLHYGMWDL